MSKVCRYIYISDEFLQSLLESLSSDFIDSLKFLKVILKEYICPK